MSREYGSYPTGDAAERFLRGQHPQWQGVDRRPWAPEARCPGAAAIAAQLARVGAFVSAQPDEHLRRTPEAARSLTTWNGTADRSPYLIVNSYAENGLSGLGTGRILISHGLTPAQQVLARRLGVDTADRLQVELHTDPLTMDQARWFAAAHPDVVWSFSTQYYVDRFGHAAKVVALPIELDDERAAVAYGAQSQVKLVEVEMTNDDVELARTAVTAVLRKLGLAPPESLTRRT